MTNTTCKLPSPDDLQFNLFDGAPLETGNRHTIFTGTTRLEGYLKRAKQQTPFIIDAARKMHHCGLVEMNPKRSCSV
jgi:hypothetical protein